MVRTELDRGSAAGWLLSGHVLVTATIFSPTVIASHPVGSNGGGGGDGLLLLLHSPVLEPYLHLNDWLYVDK